MQADINRATDATRKAVVLLVEDEFMIRWTTAAFLREAGYVVIEAENAADARIVLGSGATVDIVFTDVNLPGGDSGSMLAEWLQVHHPDLPVLITSGTVSLPAAALGDARRFLSKPYVLEELPALIESMLQRPRSST